MKESFSARAKKLVDPPVAVEKSVKVKQGYRRGAGKKDDKGNKLGKKDGTISLRERMRRDRLKKAKEASAGKPKDEDVLVL